MLCAYHGLFASYKEKGGQNFGLSDPLHKFALYLAHGQNWMVESLRYDDGQLQEMHRMLANALNAYTNLGSRPNARVNQILPQVRA